MYRITLLKGVKINSEPHYKLTLIFFTTATWMKSNSCWINTFIKVKHDEILEYYHLAMRDLQDGAPIQELEAALKMYEELEEFEKCAGILKAINEAKYMTIKNIKNGRKNN